MLNDKLTVTGNVFVKVFDAQGNVKDSREIKNLVVNAGKTFIASSILKTTNSPAAMTHMGLGTGTTTAVVGDTTLETPISGSRVTFTSSGSTAAVVTYVASFPAGTGTGAVAEAGIFNDPTAGTMLCRTVFGVVTKGANDSMSITWQITVS